MLIPIILVVAVLLVWIGTSVPPMGLLGLAAIIGAGGVCFAAYALLMRGPTTPKFSAIEKRHQKRHKRPVAGCMVCDAQHEYHQVLTDWLSKQIPAKYTD